MKMIIMLYNLGDQIYVWTNRVKVGPYHNPHETYDYFTLPFCRPNLPSSLSAKRGGFSEILEGTILQNSGIIFAFKVDALRTTLCTVSFDTEQVYQMQMAIANHYWYQLDVDGLPIWAKVGDLDISDEKFEEIERAGVRFVMRV
ncbi:uncharacterized protein [Blastocystis hominis]|uniref:Transmembrane 9 superfamily member n=1 Tax=Blastocystis hominis TaxID=12968 RepID=D8M9H2_BLAHO|nr:uncharacterized protein [Blastocystis hominis]CBK24711.2 unnamed protein product [Blastocystis hominis]|eukprot:XP_012898759.1 uncharacterized protein [Blastocystis hominis]